MLSGGHLKNKIAALGVYFLKQSLSFSHMQNSLILLVQEARAAGCRTAGEAERYIEQKMKREVEENARRVKDSSQAGPSGKYLQRINHQKGDQDTSPRGGNKSPSVLDPVGKESSSNGRGLTGSEVSDKWDVTGFIGADILSDAVRLILLAVVSHFYYIRRLSFHYMTRSIQQWLHLLCV